MRISRITALLFGFLVTTASLEGQERTRDVAAFMWGDALLGIVAAPGQVRLSASESFEYVSVLLSVDEARAFADTAAALLASTGARVGPRDRLRYEADARPDLPGDGVTLIREVSRSGSRLELFFFDLHVINTVHISVTPARARTFVNALRRAISDATELESPPPAPGAAPHGTAYFEFQVDKSAVLIPSGLLEQMHRADTRARDIEGAVQAQFVVDASGVPIVSTFKLMTATNPAFAAMVQSALQKLRYHPAEKDGSPVFQVVQQSFQFRIVR